MASDPLASRRAPPWVPVLCAALAIGAGAAAAASVGYLLVSNGAYDRYNDPSTPYDELDGLRGQANGMMTAAGVGAFVSIGFTTATIAVQF